MPISGLAMFRYHGAGESVMRGTVLDFSIQTNLGVIAGDDGNRYRLDGLAWRDSAPSSRGVQLAFEARGGQATAIYRVLGSADGGNLAGCQEQDDCRTVGDPAWCFWGPRVLTRGHQCRCDHASVVARCWPCHVRCGNVLGVSDRHHRGRHLSLEVRGRVPSELRSVPKVSALNPVEAAPSPHEPVMKKGLQWQTSGT